MLQDRLEIPAFTCGAEVLGWLYVSDRIILRHELIRNRLRVAIPETFGMACPLIAMSASTGTLIQCVIRISSGCGRRGFAIARS